MMEIWKDVKGYEGLYQVSNSGRVKRLERRVRNHKCGAMRFIDEHILSPFDNGHGYKVVCLRNGKTRKNKYVHRLVAEHFLSNPLGKKYINHLDYNTSNNSVMNLAWCSQSENVSYSVEHLKKPKSKCRLSNTGEKYITYRISKGKYSVYRVNIRSKGIDKRFKTLEEAVGFRDEVMNSGKINNKQ